jgi:hypothetical protein
MVSEAGCDMYVGKILLLKASFKIKSNENRLRYAGCRKDTIVSIHSPLIEVYIWIIVLENCQNLEYNLKEKNTRGI